MILYEAYNKNNGKVYIGLTTKTLKRWDGKRASDVYPTWVFELSSYKEASRHGVPKTTWYRQKRLLGQ